MTYTVFLSRDYVETNEWLQNFTDGRDGRRPVKDILEVTAPGHGFVILKLLLAEQGEVEVWLPPHAISGVLAHMVPSEDDRRMSIQGSDTGKE